MNSEAKQKNQQGERLGPAKSLLRHVLRILLLGIAVVPTVNLVSRCLRSLAELTWTDITSQNLFFLVLLAVTGLILWVLLLTGNLGPGGVYRFNPPRQRFGCWEAMAFYVSGWLAVGALLAIAKALTLAVPFIIRHDFSLSLLLTLAVFGSTLRTDVLRRQSWKRLGDTWLKWTGVSAVAVGGFGFVGISDEAKISLLQLAIDRSQVGSRVLIGSYLLVLLLLGCSALFKTVGGASAVDENSYQPLIWFVPAFSCAWLGNVGLFSLFLDSLILTLVAHLS